MKTANEKRAHKAYLSAAECAIPAVRLDYLKRVIQQRSIVVKILDTYS